MFPIVPKFVNLLDTTVYVKCIYLHVHFLPFLINKFPFAFTYSDLQKIRGQEDKNLCFPGHGLFEINIRKTAEKCSVFLQGVVSREFSHPFRRKWSHFHINALLQQKSVAMHKPFYLNAWKTIRRLHLLRCKMWGIFFFFSNMTLFIIRPGFHDVLTTHPDNKIYEDRF